MSPKESTPLAAKATAVAEPPKKSKIVAYFELTRLHKFPLGTLVLYWPCAIGLGLAAFRTSMSLQTLLILNGLFFVGSALTHSAACVINDICDIDFDRQVERCKTRPLVVGYISVAGAYVLLAALVAATIFMLTFTNQLAFYAALVGLFPVHGLYPLMKRWTYWPQAWLGLAMNWGLPVAWIAVTGSIDYWVVGLAFAGTWAWTIVYDTIYGCQDKKDDVKAGVKSTSLLFGDYVRPILALFAAFFVGTLAAAGVFNGQGISYFAVSCGGAALHLAWQLLTLDVDSPADCFAKFESNGNMGYIIFAGMLLDGYLSGKNVWV